MNLSTAINKLIFSLLAAIVLVTISACTAGEEYNGDLQNNLPHGFGTWKHPSGVIYIGQFDEGLWHGRGIWRHPDGIYYAGQWHEGKYHGLGTLIISGSSRYDGEWANGLKQGAGIMRLADGSVYTGWWANDRYDGFGILEKPDGYRYNGQWLDGRRHGEGTAYYSDNSQYHGQWLNDLRHGRGTLIFPDGSIYNGGWSENRQHGEGTMTFPDGTTETAVWIKGQRQVIPVESITLTPDRITLPTGGRTFRLTVEIYPEDATNQSVSWSSSNPAVASVSDGLVRSGRAGSATIIGTTEDGGFTAICTVTVSATTTAVSGVRLDRDKITLQVGETATLIATVLPANATNKTVIWSSENTAIAAAYHISSQRGGVRAYAVGTTWITVTTVDGRYTARCEITVKPAEDPADRVIVPRLDDGKTLEQAKNLILEAELTYDDDQTTFEHSDDTPEGQVISQSPAAGEVVFKGTLVKLVVSLGPAEQ